VKKHENATRILVKVGLRCITDKFFVLNEQYQIHVRTCVIDKYEPQRERMKKPFGLCQLA